MNKIWIGNGQLVLPDKIVPGGSVLLEGKKIAAVNVPCPPDARRVDVDGSYIMAGFVDIHVHGGATRTLWMRTLRRSQPLRKPTAPTAPPPCAPPP
mgnify:CR=1 FL=1